MKPNYKRFNAYEICLAVFLMINLFLGEINEKALDSNIPNEIIGYLFWLSLGLYLGFRLCRYELSRIHKKKKKKNDDENKLRVLRE